MRKLTPRERQIVGLLLQGCDNQEIAKESGLRPRTVKAYFHRLFQRYEITSGVKRVKLAVLLYREARESELAAKDAGAVYHEKVQIDRAEYAEGNAVAQSQ